MISEKGRCILTVNGGEEKFFYSCLLLHMIPLKFSYFSLSLSISLNSVFKMCHQRFQNFIFAAENLNDMSKWVIIMI